MYSANVIGPPRNCKPGLFSQLSGLPKRQITEMYLTYSNNAFDMLCHLGLWFPARYVVMGMRLRSLQARGVD